MSIHAMPVSFRRAAFVSEQCFGRKKREAKTAVLSIDPAIVRQLARMRADSSGFGCLSGRRQPAPATRIRLQA
jgi:hypothetical protein